MKDPVHLLAVAVEPAVEVVERGGDNGGFVSRSGPSAPTVSSIGNGPTWAII
jgi:hypothetical protein